MPGDADCILCRGAARDAELLRLQVWEDAHWRLTVSLYSEVPGFAYLEPKRHVPAITDLVDPEAATFGPALARASQALQAETGAERVYLYVFGGGIPHLHVQLAPHRPGDGLNTHILRGEVVARPLPSGATLLESADYPLVPEAELRALAARVRDRLAAPTGQ